MALPVMHSRITGSYFNVLVEWVSLPSLIAE